MNLFENIQKNREKLARMGLNAIRRAHAAGVGAYYLDPETGGIVRHDPDGRRWLVDRVDEVSVDVREVAPRSLAEIEAEIVRKLREEDEARSTVSAGRSPR